MKEITKNLQHSSLQSYLGTCISLASVLQVANLLYFFLLLFNKNIELSNGRSVAVSQELVHGAIEMLLYSNQPVLFIWIRLKE